MFNRLRIEAARRIGIDPDRLQFEAGAEDYSYIVSVQGPITRGMEQELRVFLNARTPAHWKLSVQASFSD